MSKIYKTPALVISDYYDSLISQLDIYTEEKINNIKLNGLPNILLVENPNKNVKTNIETTYGVESVNNPYESQKYTIDRAKIPETEVKDKSEAEEYINNMRQKAIDEIRKVEEKSFKLYKANKDKFKIDREEQTEEKLEELKSQLLSTLFCFLVKKEPIKKSKNGIESYRIFNLQTIITDFYLRECDIDYIRF